MYLKKFKLINYRKFSTENNVVEFISSQIIKRQEKQEDVQNVEISGEEQHEKNEDKADIASDTTLIIGKNNAGKTTIVTALDNLIHNENAFGVNDFNYGYLKKYFDNYDVDNPVKNVPVIEFVITIVLEDESNDRISNVIPFMLVEDTKDSELDIHIKYEAVECAPFHKQMKIMIEKQEERDFSAFLDLLKNTKYRINYYDKNSNKIENNYKLSNLMDIKCIKANHLKNEHCLTDAFNKIVTYRYNSTFSDDKKNIEQELSEINKTLTGTIKEKHTYVLKEVLRKLVSTNHMEVNLSADITFDKLMKDLIRYEYVENDIHVPESQFGLGYTNLVLIIADIIDYMERYPDDTFNSKINLISIEEPETFMHPQMQELFIKNINEAIRLLLCEKKKNINSQIVITTHSAHILNSKIQSTNTFDNICYLHEKEENSCATNLCNENLMPDVEDEEKQKEAFKFLKKHIKFKVSELFFSDAAIFVEGFAEDILVPFYLEDERRNLNKFYISVFNINGAHGFLYKRLIEALGIPVVIITDLDIKREKAKEDKKAKDTEHNEQETIEENDFSQIDCLDGKETTNKTIINFFKEKIDDIPAYKEINNIYLTYQGVIEGYYATSFEEAFILTNYDNVIVNELLKEIKPGIYKSIVESGNDYKKNKENSYKWQVKLENSKEEFASKLLYRIVNEEVEENIPKLPEYIEQGLKWLENKLNGEGGISE